MRPKVPPSIIEAQSSQAAEVAEHSNVSIQCKASGQPKPIVTWRRSDGAPIRLVGAATRNNSAERLPAHKWPTRGEQPLAGASVPIIESRRCILRGLFARNTIQLTETNRLNSSAREQSTSRATNSLWLASTEQWPASTCARLRTEFRAKRASKFHSTFAVSSAAAAPPHQTAVCCSTIIT